MLILDEFLNQKYRENTVSGNSKYCFDVKILVLFEIKQDSTIQILIKIILHLELLNDIPNKQINNHIRSINPRLL